MLLVADEGRVVRHGDGAVRPEEAVVLDDEDPWRDDVDRFEEPVVVAVEVDREQSDRPADACPLDDPVHVLAIDERRHGVDRVPPAEPALLEEAPVRVGGVHDHAAPGVVNEQEAGVRLGVVLDAELDENPAVEGHALDEELDDPVLAEL